MGKGGIHVPAMLLPYPTHKMPFQTVPNLLSTGKYMGMGRSIVDEL